MPIGYSICLIFSIERPECIAFSMTLITIASGLGNNTQKNKFQGFAGHWEPC